MERQERIMIACAVPFVLFGVVYLVGAFVAGTFDSTLWDPIGKTFLSIFWVIGSLVIIAGIFDKLKDL